ncbi:MAG: hypothetical protein RIC06_02785 [Cyclobacteriaceae bacterium]
MKESEKKYYKIFSLITLASSLSFLVMFINQDFPEKLRQVIGVNLAFHLVFQFSSKVPFGMVKFITNVSQDLVRRLMKGFSIAIMCVSVVGAFGISFHSIAEGDYERLLVLNILNGMFLGAFYSKIKLSSKGA